MGKQNQFLAPQNQTTHRQNALFLRPDIAVTAWTKMAKFWNLALFDSKCIIDFRKFAMRKCGSFLVADAIYLRVFVGFLCHHFLTEGFLKIAYNFVITERYILKPQHLVQTSELTHGRRLSARQCKLSVCGNKKNKCSHLSHTPGILYQPPKQGCPEGGVSDPMAGVSDQPARATTHEVLVGIRDLSSGMKTIASRFTNRHLPIKKKEKNIVRKKGL